MQAGKLRTKVTFQEETETSDGGGGYVVGWGNDQVVFCEFISQSGKETIESGRMESTVRAKLVARAKSVSFLNAGWKAVIDGVDWNVKTVIPFGQRDRRTDIVIETGTSV